MKRRSGIKVMGQLIGLVFPLLHIMAAAICLGVIGFLCAIFLTILAGGGLVYGLQGKTPAGLSPEQIFLLLVILACARGILHYGEQACNHYIAFKLLAIIRHKVFAALRRLCPAKLEGRDKGNLIALITSDIELLEVFYAHTVSPIAIGVLTSLIMVFFIGHYHRYAGIWALVSYLIVGAVIPLRNGRKGAQTGMEFRNGMGELNAYVLDSLRGLEETIQYGGQQARKTGMSEKSANLARLQAELSRGEGNTRAVTNLAILISSFGMLFFSVLLFEQGQMDLEAVLICTIAMMGSFGPVVALANLSNNLNQTLASGERVLAILEEKPQVEEVSQGKDTVFENAACEKVTFSYEEETILKDYSIVLEKGKITGIHGKSGSGKSTLLKLLMRFWDVQEGKVKISGEDVRQINTGNLRDMEAYVTQETYLFHDSIENNIRIAKPQASRQEIVEAAKKASIHLFIQSLPKGYDTPVGELGDTLSGGERQRIGIARAFLHNAPLLLLDEPTSNLDSLNEGIILKALKEECRDKTVVLVSHRQSTMKIADRICEMENQRLS